ncbi:MAG TPA: Ni/Fe-hydrogenase cytochrome b subunit, partial [Azonexus sp.]|nr:Ni/Fe-hydrogenase cytochrome b subunit [Azonexus sp.]
MSAHQHAAPAPVGGKLFNTATFICGLFIAITIAILITRFLFGLGAVTNLNDGYPWGIWVVFDVLIGSAFACGGFSVAMLVYIFNKGEYHPLVRPALLASLFGYTLAGVGVLFDLGRYW